MKLKEIFGIKEDPIKREHDLFVQTVASIPLPLPLPDNIPAVHFKHSGNAGDIIYSIPTMLALARSRPIHIYLKCGVIGDYGNMKHPLGNLMLNKAMVDLLAPLLLSHPQIAVCEEYIDQPIHVDLDLIRKYPLLLDRGHIARWYFLVFAVNYDLTLPWLYVEEEKGLEDTIVIARSSRYQAPGIDYDFLNEYQNLAFVGLQPEYEAMQRQLPSLRFIEARDFLHLASIIKGAKLFIGNQSLPFAIAEALKVKRLVEVYYRSPNVIVEGTNGYDFCFQPQFQKLVKELTQ